MSFKVTAVQRSGGSAGRNELRQHERQAAEQGGRPDVRQVHDLAQELAGLPGQLGTAELTPLPGEQPREVAVVVDPDAAAQAGALVEVLRNEDAPQEVKEAVERLDQSLGQHQALAGCVTTGTELLARLRGTERWAALGERACLQRFYERADALLEGKVPGVGPEDRARLRAALGPVLRERQTEAVARAAEADKTRAASAEATAIVESAAHEAHMVQTAMDLQDERPVSATDLEAAIETYKALQGGAQ